MGLIVLLVVLLLLFGGGGFYYGHSISLLWRRPRPAADRRFGPSVQGQGLIVREITVEPDSRGRLQSETPAAAGSARPASPRTLRPGMLENAQAMTARCPRTTKLNDRTGAEITLDEVERITI
jgi:hypothetical protein